MMEMTITFIKFKTIMLPKSDLIKLQNLPIDLKFIDIDFI